MEPRLVQEIHEAALRRLVWQGYRRLGKPRDIGREIRETRAALATRRGVPIDICMVNDEIMQTLPHLEGLHYEGRRYIHKSTWYLGNMESARLETPQ